MAGIDKIYSNQDQYHEFKEWLTKNQKEIKCKMGATLEEDTWKDIIEDVLPVDCLYGEYDYTDDNDRPISNFPEKIDKWLLKKCPLKWVTDRIKEQYGIIN